ncbi:MAG: hypothetical protein ABEK84_01600 [Salinibacter sp.]
MLGGLLWGLVLPVASAQQTHTLNIHNGTVYVDGKPLSEDQLPDSLNLKGISAHYRFLGIRRPVIELNGRLFAVDDGLTPVSEEEVRQQRASVILGGRTPRSRAPRGRRRASAGRGEYRQYLNAIQRSSRELYERLLRERRMEQRARDLARAIQLLPNGPERQAKIDTLRAMLEDIFELKQENRRREIRRLQRQIRELQRNLQKRAQMRDRMIDRRLQQLVDTTRER